MKAMVYTKSGGLDVLKIQDIPKPVPKENQVLISVKACALNVSEYDRFQTLSDNVPVSVRVTNALMGYIGVPLGTEISGVVVSVGKCVMHVRIGDEVYGKTAGTVPKGGIAEFALMDKERVFNKPKNLSFEEASTISVSFDTALGAVRKAGIQAGDEIMVYGSSGGVGLFAVQLAKNAGAHVTGVCSTRNLAIAKRAGCDTVIDYKTEDFTKCDKKFDAILGINGYNSMNDYRKLLKESGIFVGVGSIKQAMKAMIASFTSKKFTFYMGAMTLQMDYLSYGKKLAESGKIVPFIDKIYSVKDTNEAIRYGVEEHAQGKIVVKIDF